MALTKKKGTKATPKLPDINALKQVNSNDAGAFYNSLFSAQHKVEYANKDIALSNIRTNPDNEIFRNLDEEDDIRILIDAQPCGVSSRGRGERGLCTSFR